MSISVPNPRTGLTDYTFEPFSADSVSRRAAELRVAQANWEQAGAVHRASVLSAWAAAIATHRKNLVEALLADTGRMAESEMEVDAALGMIERWKTTGPALLAEDPAHPAALPFISVAQVPRPYQIAGVISPWNFPLLLSLIDTIPALIAGSCVIVKPSEVTPRFVDALRPAIEAVPELNEVLAFVQGDGATGSALIDVVDLICFTGSVATGKQVAAQAAERFIPAFLELGGKDPAIVLESANLERAARALVWGSTANAGQACQSIERIYVQASVYQTFVGLLTECAGNVRLAYPEVSDGPIGPIIAPKQRDIIARHLADAKQKGAKALTGGAIEILGGGAYLKPTVLVDVDHSMKVMTEETFGPILPVMPFNDSDEAVRLANDSEFGLSAAVFAGTTEEARNVARRIDAGAVSINDAALTAFVQDGEKNSFKMSGLGGSRMGPASVRRFLRKQAHLINTDAVDDPWWR